MFAKITINAAAHRYTCIQLNGTDNAASVYDESAQAFFAYLEVEAKSRGFKLVFDGDVEAQKRYMVTDHIDMDAYVEAVCFMASDNANIWLWCSHGF